LKVKTFVGADGVDYWKREQWIEQIKECDVGVMTPQVFLNLSDNAYWRFENVEKVPLISLIGRADEFESPYRSA